IYIAGRTGPWGTTGKVMLLIKLDPEGNEIWNREWSGSNDMGARAIAFDSNENIYLVGRPDNDDIFLRKYDADGNVDWTRTWGGTGGGYENWPGICGIFIDDSDNIFVTGRSDTLGAGGQDMILVHYNVTGDLQWSTTWGYSGNERGYDVVKDSEDHLYVTSFSSSTNDLHLVKFDANTGDQIWNTSLGIFDIEGFYKLDIDDRDYIYIAGTKPDNNRDISFLIINKDGNIVKEEGWSTNSYDIGNFILLNEDREIYVAGTTTGIGAGQEDVVIIKYKAYTQTWNLSPFTIDDNGGGDYTWAEAVLEHWCTGSGTWSDPYILENIIINGLNSSSCLTIKDSSKYFIIQNCTLFNAGLSPYAGLKLDHVQNGFIYNNNVSYNNRWGIHINSGYNNTIYKNLAIRNIGNNIFLSNTYENLIEQNIASEGDYTGIKLENSYNNTVFNNTANGNDQVGINVAWRSHDNNVVGNIALNNDYGIRLENNATKTNIIDNIFESNLYGIGFWEGCNETVITGNTIKDNTQYGINIYSYTGIHSDNNLIYNNSFISNAQQARDYGINNQWDNGSLGNYWSDYGGVDFNDDGIGDTPYSIIGIAGSQDNYPIWDDGDDFWVLSYFIIDNSGIGDYTWEEAVLEDWCSGQGTMLEPYVIKNVIINADGNDYGLKISNSEEYFRIENCTISNSKNDGYFAGIILENVENGILIENQVSFNYNGILLMSSSYNLIEKNNASNCNEFGIIVTFDSNHNEIIENICDYNADMWGYGIGATVNSDFNQIHNNNVTGNTWSGLTIRDGSHNNTISCNRVIANNHGIEIYNNCDDNIVVNNTIINNSGNGGWDRTSDCEDNVWYLNYFNNIGGNNAQEVGASNYWDNGSLGNYWSDYGGVDEDDNGIGDTPYVSGNLIDNFPIWEDGDDLSPSIVIIAPLPDQLFGVNSPTFNVEILDPNLDTMWYTIDGGLTNITFIANGTIDQDEWNMQSDGIVILTFYANDTLGHTNSGQVTVYKDSTSPIIEIIAPLPDQLFGVNSPTFNVEISDPNLDTMWYTLDDGLTNNTFITNGTLDQDQWTAHLDGTVSLNFYANDTLGNINSAQVTIYKDSTSPIIEISAPLPDQLFGVNSPTFNVEILDPNLDTMWYTIDGGLTNITFTANGTIDQDDWTDLIDGSVSLIFYANDTLGYINSAQVTIYKDSTSPIIEIISPLPDQLFGASSPDFIVECSGDNIDSIWYSIDGGINNYTITGNGTINQDTWNSMPNGTISIKFYINDTLGRTFSHQIMVFKDIENPILSIIDPTMNEVFEFVPAYEISLIEGNLDKIWYTLDDGENVFITETIGVLDETLWDQLSNGYITIRFYANDTLGNMSFDETIVVKDAPTPSPPPGAIPGYNLTILFSVISLITVITIKRKLKNQ
ncbi:MAG: hypothetical protein EU548_03405, partial [Promethearchaeota archaeon]